MFENLKTKIIIKKLIKLMDKNCQTWKEISVVDFKRDTEAGNYYFVLSYVQGGDKVTNEFFAPIDMSCGEIVGFIYYQVCEAE